MCNVSGTSTYYFTCTGRRRVPGSCQPAWASHTVHRKMSCVKLCPTLQRGMFDLSSAFLGCGNSTGTRTSRSHASQCHQGNVPTRMRDGMPDSSPPHRDSGGDCRMRYGRHRLDGERLQPGTGKAGAVSMEPAGRPGTSTAPVSLSNVLLPSNATCAIQVPPLQGRRLNSSSVICLQEIYLLCSRGQARTSSTQ